MCFRRLLPQRVKYLPVVPDPEQLIGRRYPVRVGVLGVPKDGVGEPDQADHIAGRIAGRQTEETQRRQKVRTPPLLNSFGFLPETHEAGPLRNKRIIKHPGDVGKTKHINQFVPLITGLFPREGRILFSNEIFTVRKSGETQ